MRGYIEYMGDVRVARVVGPSRTRWRRGTTSIPPIDLMTTTMMMVMMMMMVHMVPACKGTIEISGSWEIGEEKGRFLEMKRYFKVLY